jgi:hypothetical protein
MEGISEDHGGDAERGIRQRNEGNRREKKRQGEGT